MTSSESKYGMDSQRAGSSVGEAAIMLAIYVAMYLAVGGIVHALTSPNAVAAMAPGSGIVLSTGDTEAPSPTIAEPVLPTIAPSEGSERIKSPRECNLSAAIDTECIF